MKKRKEEEEHTVYEKWVWEGVNIEMKFSNYYGIGVIYS